MEQNFQEDINRLVDVTKANSQLLEEVSVPENTGIDGSEIASFDRTVVSPLQKSHSSPRAYGNIFTEKLEGDNDFSYNRFMDTIEGRTVPLVTANDLDLQAGNEEEKHEITKKAPPVMRLSGGGWVVKDFAALRKKLFKQYNYKALHARRRSVDDEDLKDRLCWIKSEYENKIEFLKKLHSNQKCARNKYTSNIVNAADMSKDIAELQENIACLKAEFDAEINSINKVAKTLSPEGECSDGPSDKQEPSSDEANLHPTKLYAGPRYKEYKPSCPGQCKAKSPEVMLLKSQEKRLYIKEVAEAKETICDAEELAEHLEKLKQEYKSNLCLINTLPTLQEEERQQYLTECDKLKNDVCEPGLLKEGLIFLEKEHKRKMAQIKRSIVSELGRRTKRKCQQPPPPPPCPSPCQPNVSDSSKTSIASNRRRIHQPRKPPVPSRCELLGEPSRSASSMSMQGCEVTQRRPCPKKPCVPRCPPKSRAKPCAEEPQPRAKPCAEEPQPRAKPCAEEPPPRARKPPVPKCEDLCGRRPSSTIRILLNKPQPIPPRKPPVPRREELFGRPCPPKSKIQIRITPPTPPRKAPVPRRDELFNKHCLSPLSARDRASMLSVQEAKRKPRPKPAVPRREELFGRPCRPAPSYRDAAPYCQPIPQASVDEDGDVITFSMKPADTCKRQRSGFNVYQTYSPTYKIRRPIQIARHKCRVELKEKENVRYLREIAKEQEAFPDQSPLEKYLQFIIKERKINVLNISSLPRIRKEKKQEYLKGNFLCYRKTSPIPINITHVDDNLMRKVMLVSRKNQNTPFDLSQLNENLHM